MLPHRFHIIQFVFAAVGAILNEEAWRRAQKDLHARRILGQNGALEVLGLGVSRRAFVRLLACVWLMLAAIWMAPVLDWLTRTGMAVLFCWYGWRSTRDRELVEMLVEAKQEGKKGQ